MVFHCLVMEKKTCFHDGVMEKRIQKYVSMTASGKKLSMAASWNCFFHDFIMEPIFVHDAVMGTYFCIVISLLVGVWGYSDSWCSSDANPLSAGLGLRQDQGCGFR